MRTLSLKDRRVRIGILQSSERCIGSANNADGLRECFREERRAMQRQRKGNVAEMQQLLRSNGIQVPEGKRRGGGEGGGGMI